jgi:DNA-binding XRE family transcriptional regulator
MQVRLTPVPRTAWDARPLEPGVVVDATPATTLHAALQAGMRKCPRAFQLSRDEPAPDWSAVLLDSSTLQPLERGSAFEPVSVCLDEQGRAVWHLDAKSVTFAHIARTIEAGLLHSRTDIVGYEFPEVGGNGRAYALFDLWQTFSPWLQEVGSAVLGYAVAEVLSVIKRRWRAWKARRASPGDVIDLISAMGQRPADLARALKIGESEAQILVGALAMPASGEVDVGTDVRAQVVSTILASRHVDWYVPFSNEQAERIAAANPSLHLRQDLVYWRRSEAGTWEYNDGLPDPVPQPSPDRQVPLFPLADKASLGSELRRLRKARGWTQQHVAGLAGVGSATISRIERGRWSDRSNSTVQRLSEALGVRAVMCLWPEDSIGQTPPRELVP